MKILIQITFITISLLSFTGCSFKTPEKNELIKNPSVLKEVPNKEDEFYYLNEHFDVNNYGQIIIPKINILIDEEDIKNVDKKFLEEISTYLQKNLQSELNSVLDNNKSKDTLIMEISIDTFDVSYDMIKPWELMPIGLGIKAIKLASGFETRKLNTMLALKISDKVSKETQLLYVDYETRDKMPSFDELTFKNVQPLLDFWIKNYKKGLTELKNRK